MPQARFVALRQNDGGLAFPRSLVASQLRACRLFASKPVYFAKRGAVVLVLMRFAAGTAMFEADKVIAQNLRLLGSSRVLSLLEV